VVFGRYYVENRTYARGTGVFQLKVVNDERLEGVCTFFGDDAKINISSYVWIRPDDPEEATRIRSRLAKRKLFKKAPFMAD
jgi:hypothetical protein